MIELLPDIEVTALDLAQLFGRKAPVHVDLGCGNGSFLRTLAAEKPHINFLGVERLLRRVRTSDRKARELDNIRIVRGETIFVLHHLLIPGTIQVFYLLFPDPWPKRRHHRRRLVTKEFLDAIGNCLTDDGALFVATDDADYFGAISRLVGNASNFVVANSVWNLPATPFEQRFSSVGAAIHRLELRKISPVT